MPPSESSRPDQPSLRRQLWQAKRQHKRRLRLALGALGLFLALLVVAGFMGWLQPRGRAPVAPHSPAPGPLPLTDIQAPAVPTPSVGREDSSLFRNETIPGLIWRREGAEELEAALKAAWPDLPEGTKFFTAVQARQAVFYETSWIEVLPVAKAKAKARERLSALDPGWTAPWIERNQCWTSEDGAWGCALIPQGLEETLFLVRKRI